MTTPTEPFPTLPAARPDWLMLLRGIAGAIAGGVLGYFLFWLLSRSNFYAIPIPGALLGIGAGWAARGKSQTLGVVCVLLAIGLTLFTEWHVLFSKNHTFLDFMSKIHTLGAIRNLLMILGPVMAYWFGQGR
jgi:hypothetical protein